MKRRYILMALGWYHPKIHKGIAKFACEHNWYLMSATASDQRLPKTWHGDGIIASIVAGRGLEDFISESKLPSILIGNQRHGLDTMLIHENNREIGYMAADFFIKKGFRNFAFFWTKEHLRGNYYAEKLKESGYNCTQLIPSSVENDSASLFAWLASEIKKLPKPLALFSPDDYTASQVIAACLDAEIAVPEEVSVLGVHNDELVCENLPIPLSSVDNDFEQMGYEAAQALNNLLDGEELKPERRLISPKGVVERLSTDILAYENIEVVKALRFIKNNFQSFIDVDDVISVTTVSRRTLYTLFNQYLGRTIAAEILRCRMEAATGMLAETELSVAEIATACGFSDYRIFHRNFKKQFNISPSEWRKQQN